MIVLTWICHQRLVLNSDFSFPWKMIEKIDCGDIIRIITQALLIDGLIGESLSFKFIFLELTMWVFFKVPRVELCDKFNWIMFFTCKSYIAWLIKLIWSYKLCLSWTWFVGWRICSKPYMPTPTKAFGIEQAYWNHENSR